MLPPPVRRGIQKRPARTEEVMRRLWNQNLIRYKYQLAFGWPVDPRKTITQNSNKITTYHSLIKVYFLIYVIMQPTHALFWKRFILTAIELNWNWMVISQNIRFSFMGLRSDLGVHFNTFTSWSCLIYLYKSKHSRPEAKNAKIYVND